jgi:glutathione synthase/RimK-type ligase-like ATP-grasp enzyme
VRKPHWVSNYDAIRSAQHKPLQLAVARRHGLKTPATLITNSPVEARQFAERQPTVYKPLASYSLEYEAAYTTVFTTLLRPNDIDQLDLVRRQVSMFQQLVVKSFEVRATVVGREVFAAKLMCSGYADIIDWRVPESNEKITYAPAELPAGLTDRVVSLVHALGLIYGAVDLAMSQTGEWYFFEVNPIGQWLWIEEQQAYPSRRQLPIY